MKFNEVQWSSMKFNGVQWSSMIEVNISDRKKNEIFFSNIWFILNNDIVLSR